MHEKGHHIDWERDWLEGNLSSEEVKEKMGRTDEIVALLRSGEQAARLNVPTKRSKEEIWSILVDKVNEEPKTRVIPLHTRTWISIAASIVLLVGAFFVFKQIDTVNHKTAFGQTASFRLPDNSVVTLNAGSALSYSKRKWKRERSLSLKGEAFFEVQKGSNFEVNTKLGLVEVLGTSFNVKTYNKQLVVACKTGKVRVTATDQVTHVITPGQRVRAKLNEVMEAPEEIPASGIDSWIEGEIEIESTNLDEVFQELERQFDIKVELGTPKPIQGSYSGYFKRNDLKSTLDEMCLSMGLEYEIQNDDKVMIRNKK